MGRPEPIRSLLLMNVDHAAQSAIPASFPG